MFTKARLLPFLKRGLSCDLVRPSLLCGGALVGLQRRPRCNPTSVPLGCNKGPVARCRPLFLLFFSCQKLVYFFKNLNPRGSYCTLFSSLEVGQRWILVVFYELLGAFWAIFTIFVCRDFFSNNVYKRALMFILCNPTTRRLCKSTGWATLCKYGNCLVK